MAESWPWVSQESSSTESQVRALAARQRQDVAEIVTLLTNREHSIDFGSFPTEYTDQQFLSLTVLIARLKHSQKLICDFIETARTSVSTSGDFEAAELLRTLAHNECEIQAALGAVEKDLAGTRALL